ncbi:hypothetical protein [Methylobacterium sp. ID0610]|uniref:hypothetical protein n=1 Tax=Methylobacterium carpenticola TaxID=3344827 RepID=UPI0036C16F82
MWRLLIGGIKAILAIGALAVVADWASRPAAMKNPAFASTLRDPATTGAIATRRKPAALNQRGLDQRGLNRLVTDSAGRAQP